MAMGGWRQSPEESHQRQHADPEADFGQAVALKTAQCSPPR